MAFGASIKLIMMGGVIEKAEQMAHPASGTEGLLGQDARSTDQRGQDVRDTELLRVRLAAGEKAAFDELTAQYAPMAARLAQRLMNWRADLAEDVVQDVFMAVWAHRRHYRGDCSPATWITRITVNQCRSYRRRHVLAFHRQKQVMETRPQINGNDKPADFIRDEQNVQIRDCVRRLPHCLREVVVLRYLEELSVEQIAETLGIRANAVNLRLSRARKRLREMPEILAIKD